MIISKEQLICLRKTKFSQISPINVSQNFKYSIKNKNSTSITVEVLFFVKG